jgi:hypothetical protein
MRTIIDRSLLTDLLLEALEPETGDPRQWVVGDHERPKDGGWQGEPGMSDWVPYLVLNATPSEPPTGDLATPGSDVWFGYAVTSVGFSRRNAEKVSATARERLASVQRQKTSDGRSISTVQVSRYGANERVPLDPALWIITDQFRIYTTK